MTLSFLNVPAMLLMRLYRKLWLRVGLYALAAALIAVIGPWGAALLPSAWSKTLSADAVTPVLTILASSMLAVSTFSLNVMVSAHRSAALNTTPRVHRLLLEDTTTQSVLGVFIGAFVYALTSIVLTNMEFYSEEALLAVMVVTVLVVALVIGAMLRWIEHLSTLGSLDDTLRFVSDRTKRRLSAFRNQPAYGALPLADDVQIPETCTDILAPQSGYIQLIDVHGLSNSTPERATTYVLRRPGHHVLKNTVLAQVSGTQDDDALSAILENFTIGDQRSFEQDPLFGLQVLSEIASRALSPGTHDPGTAVQVLNILSKLLWEASHIKADEPESCAQNVILKTVDSDRIFERAFEAIARDGKGFSEVEDCLYKGLSNLENCPDPDFAEAARKMHKAFTGTTTDAPAAAKT
ncbi:putative membrane protein [Pacificibacter maritimus]|uniref:Putative membrane protein n=1 Tax=Pacificibacter maritimus TaxID=762213 RepID=A0A3N4U900_9RHOB|nr:DUF2254 domain-containing protein [Pacificibacter maritimus]RPE67216.1 putative membrane protein [Pacificibacter maritimus]